MYLYDRKNLLGDRQHKIITAFPKRRQRLSELQYRVEPPLLLHPFKLQRNAVDFRRLGREYVDVNFTKNKLFLVTVPEYGKER